MTKQKQKKVTIKMEMDFRSALEVRQVLYDHQKGHSHEFASERINDIRKVIQEFDDKIDAIVGEYHPCTVADE
jgi:hypothetical protein